MTSRRTLSPAARAVLYDAHNRWLDVDDDIAAQVAAAALRAAADQVAPEDLRECQAFTNEAIRLNIQEVRRKLLAIAAELEAT
jgi:hypothetical protein